MQTIVHNLNGIKLLAPPEIEWPTYNITEFGLYCGPGNVGDYIVPDTMWGLKVSAACYVHDYMWQNAEPTWVDFHHANSTFLHNLQAIIQDHGGILKYLRIYRAATYYMAVDIGAKAKLFWNNEYAGSHSS